MKVEKIVFGNEIQVEFSYYAKERETKMYFVLRNIKIEDFQQLQTCISENRECVITDGYTSILHRNGIIEFCNFSTHDTDMWDYDEIDKTSFDDKIFDMIFSLYTLPN